MATFQSLPGFREFYPESLARRNHLFRCWRQSAHAYGFQEYDAPVLEPLDLYKAKSGDEIEAQLFSFTDKGGREVALRPEMTPTVCRLVGAKANALKRPIKWFSIADFYRYERMQKGRGRCFAQFNADIFGEAGPEAEIELIGLLVQCLRGLGLTADDFYVRLSDRNLWFFYLEALGLNAEQTRSMLGAIDKYERLEDAAFKIYTDAQGALDEVIKAKIVAFLGIKTLAQLEAVVADLASDDLTARLDDWRRVLGGLEAMGLSDFVTVDLGVVRGLAYYTGFVFEAFDRKGDLRALAGGGRYDDLVKKLGGPELPAVGFAIGDMTMELLLAQRGLLPDLVSAPDVYAIIGGPDERLAAFGDINLLRAAGYRVDYPMRELGFGKQFKVAAESGARVALIYGSDELARGVVKLRDMTQREEVEIPRDQVAVAVRDFLTAE
ncbi:histidine--tRNA ligase [Synoicihabitans lomoniglobus]|uniref:Histidine--tRNA ligase n=1 Tax=Synoicihabitans lomoniglobus TaxID=2909285 RepID=A0AAF0CR91_9BACT|nr:histidine--tRNA ligase [Opitutaceae bacterium LMO-M01]WED66501.1 histidine--tRNA ligase [Opitutaceae bacterium LMO-M01]